MTSIFIKPAMQADGKTPNIVRQPENSMRPLPADGKFVDENEFWTRRIIQGDVVKADPPRESHAEPAAEQRVTKRERD